MSDLENQRRHFLSLPLPQSVTQQESTTALSHLSGPPAISRREFMRLTALTCIALGVPFTLTSCDVPAIEPTGRIEQESDIMAILTPLLSDPLTYTAFGDQNGNLSPTLTLAVSEAARQGASYYLDAVPPPDREIFLNLVKPALNQAGLYEEDILNAAVLTKNSPMGNIYVLEGAGKTFYIRATPLSQPEIVSQVQDGVNLQKNTYDKFLGQNDRLIFSYRTVQHSQGDVFITVSEELGKPLGTAFNELGQQTFHQELTRYFTDVLVPQAKAGYFKQDINGTNAGNIVFDQAHYRKTGMVRFNQIDFGERTVAYLNPEAAVVHTHKRMQVVFNRFHVKHPDFPPLLELSELYTHPNFADLNPALLQQEVLVINTATPDGGLRRIFLPRGILNEAGKSGDEIYEQIITIRNELNNGKRTFSAPDGTEVKLIDNAVGELSKGRQLAQLLRPAAKVAGVLGIIGEIVGAAQIIYNTDRALTRSQDLAYSFKEGENYLPIDNMFLKAILLKKNRFARNEPLTEYSPLNSSQAEVLESAGIDPAAVEQTMIEQDPMLIGLINESLSQGVGFRILNGQELDATAFFSAIMDENGNKSIIFYARLYDHQKNRLNDNLTPLFAISQTAGISGWILNTELTRNFHQNNIVEYANFRIYQYGRQGDQPPPGYIMFSPVDEKEQFSSLKINFTSG